MARWRCSCQLRWNSLCAQGVRIMAIWIEEGITQSVTTEPLFGAISFGPLTVMSPEMEVISITVNLHTGGSGFPMTAGQGSERPIPVQYWSE
uniref:Uncharacterized protein n=1 Tax=Magnetococcus massalia (strain MO-1) TaxID=451514 RepID=A0A1S7LJM7_MAGMO|nr:Protein of unknown function [Candidatus Magnetococcus massalia]